MDKQAEKLENVVKRNKKVNNMMKGLDVKATMIGFGVAWSVLILLLGWFSILGWDKKVVVIMSSLYIGYKPTFLGSLIGALWGFIDGAIWGGIIALVYNAVIRKKS